MADDWSSSEFALLLALDPGPRYGARLQARMREALRSGSPARDDRLPSSRELASQLGVARGTVVPAYEQLVAEGYLVSTPGGRTRVSSAAARTAPPAAPAPNPLHARFDLRPGVPELRSFPATDWSWALSEAARRIRPADLDYGTPQGHRFAREVIAGHLLRARAAAVDPEQVVLATGFAQCVTLTFAALAAQGVRTLAVEDPGDRSIDAAARDAGLIVVPIRVDEQGLDVAELERSRADAVVVTPAHQAPTGAVLSPERRTALAAWAARTGGWIVEDDYDSEFRYDRRPVGSLQGLAPDRVILIGTTSKTHAPGLRIAWIAAPAALRSAIVDEKRDHDRGSSAIDQLAFALLVDSGRHDRHVRAMRARYASRRRTVLAALAARLPELSLTGVDAGFHGVLALPSGLRERQVIDAGAAASLRLTGLAAATVARDDLPPSLVIGFGNLDDESVPDAVDALAWVLENARFAPPG
jgi:GntR family transcriptional regulator/MocR family aminotransferase